MIRTGLMEEVHQKLGMLHYPRASVPSQSLLYAGLERYALLEWLFFRLLGDKSPFTQQGLLGDGADRDEEAARIQYLAEIAKYLGLTTAVDPDAIQGKGSYESRAEMLHLTVELVEASSVADNPEWSCFKQANCLLTQVGGVKSFGGTPVSGVTFKRSIDDQVAKDVLLVDAIAEKQTQVFSDECKLFPADVQIMLNSPVQDIVELESQLSEQMKDLANLQTLVTDLAAKKLRELVGWQQSYNPNEDHAEAEVELRTQLEAFLDAAKAFNIIYAKEIRPWTHTMEVPQLHGLGPAAHRLLESYKLLIKLLRNLRNMRDSHSAVATGSDISSEEDSLSSTLEVSSLVQLVAECEEALLLLNNGLGILSLSLERDSGATSLGDEQTNC